jgi:hypothetical protein
MCLWPEESRMQCACAIISSVNCPALQYFPTLSHKRQDFRGKGTEHKMCVFIFSTALSATLLTRRRNEGDTIKNVYWSTCKVHVILVKV